MLLLLAPGIAPLLMLASLIFLHPSFFPSIFSFLTVSVTGVVVGFVQTVTYADEEKGSVTVSVAVLSGFLAETVSLLLTAADGNAVGMATPIPSLVKLLSIVLAPGDFVYGTSVTIQLTPSRPSTSVTIQIIDDSIRESEEYFTLSLRNISVDISSTVLVNPSRATVRIRDKDGITRHQLFTSECYIISILFFPRSDNRIQPDWLCSAGVSGCG